MGYRSDVRIVTSKKGFEKLKDYVSKTIANSENPNMYNLMENLNFEHENDYSKYFGWNNINWYYADVNIIINGLHKLEEEDLSYRFARMGENYDDYEEESYESEQEEEQDLEYPCFTRGFDDDYVIEQMDQYKKIEDNIEL